jgi:hydrogenase/urease accessory protein HupE
MKLARFLACLLILTGFMSSLQAHQVPSVELEFLKTDHQWWLEGEMDIAYMLPETRNVPGGPPMSRAAAMKSSPQEFARIRKETENTLRKLVKITFADKDVKWRIEFPDFQKDPPELPPEAGDIALITARMIIDEIPGAGELRAHWAGEQETELIILTEEGEDANVVSTLPGGDLMLLKQTEMGKSAPVKQPVTGGWMQLGFHHVIGIDHILFILGLFLLIPKWKPLMQQSLLFTLAHSITLALAICGVVHVPGIWVEHLIALSIAWVGIENLLLRRQLNKQRLILVFCFGLLHGLGFASVLSDKLSGISGGQLVGPLLGFNVGVELAQLAILVLAFLLIWPLRKYALPVQTLGSAFIAVAGIGWVAQRLFFPASPLF